MFLRLAIQRTIMLLGLLGISLPVVAQSPAECAAQAEIHSTYRNPDLDGVARGSSAGLAMGAVVGSPVHGLLAGGIIGGARDSEQRDIDYDRAYRRCMYGLQHMR